MALGAHVAFGSIASLRAAEGMAGLHRTAAVRRQLLERYPPTPYPFKALPISPRIAGSSMVAGMVHGSPSAIFFMVPRKILPDRVFGSRATVMASLKAATGPI